MKVEVANDNANHVTYVNGDAVGKRNPLFTPS